MSSDSNKTTAALPCNVHFGLCDLWTDPDKSLGEILRGTADLIPALLNTVPRLTKGSGEAAEGSYSTCRYKARITLFEYQDNDEAVKGNNNDRKQPSYAEVASTKTEYWSSDHEAVSSSSHGDSLRCGLTSSHLTEPNATLQNQQPWLATNIPAPKSRGSSMNQEAGGEATAETAIRSLGRIDVFVVQQLSLDLQRGMTLSQSNQRAQARNSKRSSQHEEALRCLAKRLGRVVSNRLLLQEKERTIQALQDKERRLVESQNLARIGQWDLDLVHKHLHWSDGVYEMFRVDPARFGASYEAFLEAIHPDDRDFVDNAYTNSLKTKKPYNIIHRLLFPSDDPDEEPEIRWVNEICRTEFHPKTGQPLYSVGIVQDITELKQAQEMDRLKTAFLANMSHEIRTPLNAVMGYTDLMLLEPEGLSDRNRDYLKTIRQSGELLMSVVSDILDISKIEAGQLQIDLKPFRPIEIITLVGDNAKAFKDKFLPEKNVQLDFNDTALAEVARMSQEPPMHSPVGNVCSRVKVMGDPARIQQVLNNLVNNALKFTGLKGGSNGRVEYGIRLVEQKSGAKTSKMMEFYVSDNGVGIPEEKQQSIFEAFHQVHPSRDSHELGGTGLGLTISKHLVELMGGEMKLWSSTDSVDHGTTISFTLPYKPVDDIPISKGEKPAVVSQPAQATAQQQSTTTPDAGEQKTAAATAPRNYNAEELAMSATARSKVLVVDDNRVNLKLAVRLVNRLGYETATAMNGKEALSQYESDPSLQLILMDKEMPVMDGLEAVRQIRRRESEGSSGGKDHQRRIPVIALTAAAYKEDKEACLSAGCDAYLTKPINRLALQDVLENYSKSPSAA